MGQSDDRESVHFELIPRIPQVQPSAVIYWLIGRGGDSGTNERVPIRHSRWCTGDKIKLGKDVGTRV